MLVIHNHHRMRSIDYTAIVVFFLLRNSYLVLYRTLHKHVTHKCDTNDLSIQPRASLTCQDVSEKLTVPPHRILLGHVITKKTSFMGKYKVLVGLELGFSTDL